MENTARIADCVEFKNELHKKLYIKSGAHNFSEYIHYVNALCSDNKSTPKKEKLTDTVL